MSAPDNFDAVFSVGYIYLEQGKLDWAKANFENAVNINPSFPFSFYGLGIIYDKKGDKKLAIENYKKFVVLSDDATLKNRIEKQIKLLETEQNPPKNE